MNQTQKLFLSSDIISRMLRVSVENQKAFQHACFRNLSFTAVWHHHGVQYSNQLWSACLIWQLELVRYGGSLLRSSSWSIGVYFMFPEVILEATDFRLFEVHLIDSMEGTVGWPTDHRCRDRRVLNSINSDGLPGYKETIKQHYNLGAKRGDRRNPRHVDVSFQRIEGLYFFLRIMW